MSTPTDEIENEKFISTIMTSEKNIKDLQMEVSFLRCSLKQEIDYLYTYIKYTNNLGLIISVAYMFTLMYLV